MHSGVTAPNRVPVVLVVAVAENGVIGRNNQLPWHLKSELKYFRAVTMNKPVVMGRKDLPRSASRCPAAQILSSPGGMISRPPVFLSRPGSKRRWLRHAAMPCGAVRDEIAVIGGTEIFNQTLPVADRLALTQVMQIRRVIRISPPSTRRSGAKSTVHRNRRGPDDEYARSLIMSGGTTKDRARRERAL